ncbi:hypothetical protein TSAR_002736 [Trichomalopsis sarcophagae]|uniref:Uncharacterized protein n=1 Tax=Trichomalopsis sarcophagae TaxID=543379 RepID=A0A232FJ28_9HYME|nr:hypothetical protein TSAR_002736 [Trichomalopsis sarcophagae]
MRSKLRKESENSSSNKKSSSSGGNNKQQAEIRAHPYANARQQAKGSSRQGQDDRELITLETDDARVGSSRSKSDDIMNDASPAGPSLSNASGGGGGATTTSSASASAATRRSRATDDTGTEAADFNPLCDCCYSGDAVHAGATGAMSESILALTNLTASKGISITPVVSAGQSNRFSEGNHTQAQADIHSITNASERNREHEQLNCLKSKERDLKIELEGVQKQIVKLDEMLRLRKVRMTIANSNQTRPITSAPTSGQLQNCYPLAFEQEPVQRNVHEPQNSSQTASRLAQAPVPNHMQTQNPTTGAPASGQLQNVCQPAFEQEPVQKNAHEPQNLSQTTSAPAQAPVLNQMHMRQPNSALASGQIQNVCQPALDQETVQRDQFQNSLQTTVTPTLVLLPNHWQSRSTNTGVPTSGQQRNFCHQTPGQISTPVQNQYQTHSTTSTSRLAQQTVTGQNISQARPIRIISSTPYPQVAGQNALRSLPAAVPNWKPILMYVPGTARLSELCQYLEGLPQAPATAPTWQPAEASVDMHPSVQMFASAQTNPSAHSQTNLYYDQSESMIIQPPF